MHLVGITIEIYFIHFVYLTFVLYIPENSHIFGRNVCKFIMYINGLKRICVHLLVPLCYTKADIFVVACSYSMNTKQTPKI